MPIRTYVQRRKAGTYYFRKKLPLDMRMHISKGEFIRSLETTNPKKALTLAIEIEQKLDNVINIARKEGTAQLPKLLFLIKDGTIKKRMIPKEKTHLNNIYDTWVMRKNPAPSSKASVKNSISRFIELNGNIPIDQITREHGKKYLNELVDNSELSKNSIKRTFGAITTLLNFSIGIGELENNPLTSLKIEKEDDSESRTVFSLEELT